eukprot:8250462-Alexandrium_andersonii.AAC.1
MGLSTVVHMATSARASPQARSIRAHGIPGGPPWSHANSMGHSAGRVMSIGPWKGLRHRWQNE